MIRDIQAFPILNHEVLNERMSAQEQENVINVAQPRSVCKAK